MESFVGVTQEARRAAARKARDAFPPMGVFAIRARESGHVYIASSRNVHAALNRAQFEMRMGKYADRKLQACWNAGGVDALSFEVLELVKEREDPAFDYAAELSALQQIYRELQTLSP